MFRLKVKIGRRWKLGIVIYNDYESALRRVEFFQSKGTKVKIVDSLGSEL